MARYYRALCPYLTTLARHPQKGKGMMSSIPKVSVVMPCYNAEAYLHECLDSVVRQTLRNIEILCVNDGSSDSTLDIMREFAAADKRILVIDKPNTGYGHSMNTGIDAASGEYIGIVESDDCIMPEMYEALYGKASSLGLDLIKSDLYRFKGDGSERVLENKVLSPNTEIYGKLVDPGGDPSLMNLYLLNQTGIFKRSFLADNGIRFNETPGASYQDNGFWFQTFSMARRAYFLSTPYYMLRRDNPNSSVNNKGKVFCICDEYDYIRKFLDKHPDIAERFVPMYQKRKFDNYSFSFERIADEHKMLFLRRMSVEFYIARAAGELHENLFSKGGWDTLNRIIDEPESYCADVLGSSAGGAYVVLLEQRLKRAEDELKSIRSSPAYRIARPVMQAPVRIKTAFHAWRRNGTAYVFRRMMERIRRRQ